MRAILLVLGWYYAERFEGMELVWPDRPPSIEEEMQWPVRPPDWWEPLVPLVESPVVVAPRDRHCVRTCLRSHDGEFSVRLRRTAVASIVLSRQGANPPLCNERIVPAWFLRAQHTARFA